MVAMVAVPRVMAWIAGLVMILRTPEPIERRAARSLAQFCLHSGFWLLAIAVAAIWYVASLSQPRWLWALAGGIALGTALLAGAVVLAYVRSRRPTLYTPLTPELLLKKRRRFFWINSLVFGGVSVAGMEYQHVIRDAIDCIVIFTMGFGGGWGWSWFMWQFVSAQLLAREEQRQRQEKKEKEEWLLTAANRKTLT